ncbi:hypothetical protein BG261_06455 [Floricoccus tropicus]|uniref:Uncharacterized protein n=1 Tax=Floricoccus tropicus TaxID=1859473 RepID=A0A1E8GJV7_9LACT|nr:hypothetical protein BG261_06455 [Floricoccus tropicus]
MMVEIIVFFIKFIHMWIRFSILTVSFHGFTKGSENFISLYKILHFSLTNKKNGPILRIKILKIQYKE